MLINEGMGMGFIEKVWGREGMRKVEGVMESRFEK